MKNSASTDNVAEYEQFLHTRLQTDLNDACSLFQALTQEQDDYRALGQNIQWLVKVGDTTLCPCAACYCLLDSNLRAG